jgi:hypothetical protein
LDESEVSSGEIVEGVLGGEKLGELGFVDRRLEHGAKRVRVGTELDVEQYQEVYWKGMSKVH